MKELTKAEEQIMHILWKLKEGVVNDIIDNMSDPKPAYNTVSTIVRILEKKGFVDHKAYGKTHLYFPLMSKKEYTRSFMKKFMSRYFENSFREMVSFFAKEDNMSVSEIEELMQDIKKDIETKD
ncbi:MAG: BlaI/MecI/CopY family transcriptional regulator [Prolixibacteraceae bacterium]|nr:BlaI/MecI/CopY family transcriptional regulator [Prolixibacteraceae bacterium]